MFTIPSSTFFCTGSPAVLGDEEDVELDDDDDAIDLNYISESQKQKQKIAERMMSWQMAYGQAQDLPPPNYDKEVSFNHIPLLTNGQEVVQYVVSIILSFCA